MEIGNGFELVDLASLFLATLVATFLWKWMVPRNLKGLQVAFQRMNNHYEVHTVTKTVESAKELLNDRRMRFGVINYVSALTGILLLLFDWTFVVLGVKEYYSAFNIGAGLVMVLGPALVSAVVSLGTQLSSQQRDLKVTLQDSSITRDVMYIILGALWIGIIILLYQLLSIGQTDLSERRSLALFLLFLPAVIAYGRVMGSSWLPLMRSNKLLSQGKPSDLHPTKPSIRRQTLSLMVYVTAVAMPFTALNSLISLIIITFSPDTLIHSNKVLTLPEYTLQTSVMEEGGVLGFYAIELFANISEPGIRIPLVTAVLLFLLLNVAIVGIAFVYEVARILFLGLGDIAGKGGIKIADPRLLRADRPEQAKVLNFCFTGFAGQSMLLMMLAMITFWDSTFLPGGSQCGSWQNTVCSVFEKETLERLTWMLAAGGQIAFLFVWLPSWNERHKLDNIILDAGRGQKRAKMRSYEDNLFLKQKPFTKLLSEGNWSKAISRYEMMVRDPKGIEFVRRTHAGMILNAARADWDEAEEQALSLLALRGGEDAPKAQMILVAASLAQRDYPEANPRLDRLPTTGYEGVALRWIATILSPGEIDFDMMNAANASMSPSVRINRDLLNRWRDLKPWSDKPHANDPLGRRLLLGDVARMRIMGESSEALNKLEWWIHKHESEDWVMGKVARSLLLLDKGLTLSAAKQCIDASKLDKNDPAVRELVNQMHMRGYLPNPPPSAPSIFDWKTPQTGQESLARSWIDEHKTQPVPISCSDHRSAMHTWDTNGWALLKIAKQSGQHPAETSLRRWVKKVGMPNVQPFANHLLLSGLLTTIDDMPVDLGWPADLNPNNKIVSQLIS